MCRYIKGQALQVTCGLPIDYNNVTDDTDNITYYVPPNAYCVFNISLYGDMNLALRTSFTVNDTTSLSFLAMAADFTF